MDQDRRENRIESRTESRTESRILPEQLDEDDYVEALSSIIKRDFFPDLDQRDKPTVDTTGLSLDAFQAKYTSEDNASFQSVLHKQNEATRDKYSWIFDKEKKQLLLQCTNDSLLLHNNPSGHLDAIHVDEWKYTAKNALIFGPEGAPLPLNDVKPPRGDPKAIIHSATRFGAPSYSMQETHASTLASEYSLVASTPTPVIHRDIDPADMMTWGVIEGTPLLLDQGNGPSFKMPPTPRRETLGLALADKASKSLKRRTSNSITKHTSNLPSTHSSIQRAFSPAAQRLLSNARQTPIRASSSLSRPSTPSLDQSLRSAYSKSPAIRTTSSIPADKSITEVDNKHLTDGLIRLK